MADGTKQSADETIATDEVGAGVAAGQKVQRVKAGFGTDGEYTDVSAGTPLPAHDISVLEALEFIQELLEGTRNVKVNAALPAGANAIGKVIATELEKALPAGTNAIGKLAANSGVDIGDVDVTSLTGGTVAHDAADSGNPIKVGGRARTALPEAISQNDRSDLMTDKFGRQLVSVIPLDQRSSGTLNRTNNEAGQILAAVENVAYVVTAVKVVNAHATVGTKVEILDGETVKDKGYAGPLGGGWALADPNGLFVCTKNTKLNGKCATTGADVDITVSAYKIPA